MQNLEQNRIEMNSSTPPLVSIACITYNHEPYIRQCLDGFVMQRTDFQFEIVIHDDASTDNTKKIIQEYCLKYPGLFHPIFQDVNRYKEGKGILAPFVFPECRGKYIALCEGDDYWTDPLKLQKQVNFLERNPSYSMCFTNAIQHFEDGSIPDRPFSNLYEKDYLGVELFRNWCVPTASIVLKRDIIQSNLFQVASTNQNFVFGDIILILTCASLGKVKALPLFTSVYRVTGHGALVRQDSTEEGQLSYIKHIMEIPRVFGEIYKKESDRIILFQYYSLAKASLEKKDIFKMLEHINKSLHYSVYGTLGLYCRKVFHI